MTEVQSIQSNVKARCNYSMDPYPLDVWGATGGKNSKDIWDVLWKKNLPDYADCGQRSRPINGVIWN